jgi:hypothetical protein
MSHHHSRATAEGCSMHQDVFHVLLVVITGCENMHGVEKNRLLG